MTNWKGLWLFPTNIAINWNTFLKKLDNPS